MFPSPAKRRKSNSSSAIPIPTSNAGRRPPARSARTRVAAHSSFLSPTKASIARSNSELLSKVLGSPAERALRSEKRANEVLNSEEPNKSQNALQKDEKNSDGAASQSDSNPINESQTVDLPVSELVKKPSQGGSGHQDAGNGVVRRSARRALFSAERRSLSLESPMDDTSQFLKPRNDSPEEIGLPPVRAPFGVGKLPVRSKVRADSSPSLQLELRRSRRTSEHRHGSSPLKQVSAQIPGLEDGHQDGLPKLLRSKNDVSEEVREKEKVRDELSRQLKRLKRDLATLEEYGQRFEQKDASDTISQRQLEEMLSLLTTNNPSCAPPLETKSSPPISSLLSYLLPFSTHIPQPRFQREATPLPENPFALEQPDDPLPYLTLFAPLRLATSTKTVSSASLYPKELSSRLVQVHNFTLSPPPEFPQSIYRVPITLQSDPEQQTILSISISDPSQGAGVTTVPTELLGWMQTRLSNPLLKHDVSGLSWGVCRYWEACISRAKIWLRLEKLSSNINGAKSAKTDADSGIENFTPRMLVPHLDRPSLLLNYPDEARKYQLLVSCPMEIDLWTSEPFLQPDICISTTMQQACGAGEGKVEVEARRVFWSMLKHHVTDIEIDHERIVRAVEAVVRVLHGSE